jgi:hypothetical protein
MDNEFFLGGLKVPRFRIGLVTRKKRTGPTGRCSHEVILVSNFEVYELFFVTDNSSENRIYKSGLFSVASCT